MMSKWTLIIIGLIVVFVILYFTGNKSVHHQIKIEASPKTVWAVLTNIAAYPEWNPVMELKEGQVEVGNKVVYIFTQDAQNQSTISATVKKKDPNKLLNQAGGMPMVLTFDHTYTLTQEGEATVVTIHEDYKGVFVNFWNPAPVQLAYQRLNEALKTRAESLK